MCTVRSCHLQPLSLIFHSRDCTAKGLTLMHFMSRIDFIHHKHSMHYSGILYSKTLHWPCTGCMSLYMLQVASMQEWPWYNNNEKECSQLEAVEFFQCWRGLLRNKILVMCIAGSLSLQAEALYVAVASLDNIVSSDIISHDWITV